METNVGGKPRKSRAPFRQDRGRAKKARLFSYAEGNLSATVDLVAYLRTDARFARSAFAACERREEPGLHRFWQFRIRGRLRATSRSKRIGDFRRGRKRRNVDHARCQGFAGEQAGTAC